MIVNEITIKIHMSPVNHAVLNIMYYNLFFSTFSTYLNEFLCRTIHTYKINEQLYDFLVVLPACM